MDVRSHPTSKWPQWQWENMTEWLPAAGYELEHMPGLGGWTAAHLDRYREPMTAVGVDLAIYAGGAFPKQRIGRSVPPGTHIDPDCPLHGAGKTPPMGKRRCSCDKSCCAVEGIRETDPQWENIGLRDYSWYTTTDEFQDSLRALIAKYGAAERPHAAIMCAEATWWRCHRSMVADCLLVNGIDVLHIKPQVPARPTTARWTAHSATIGNRLARYAPAIIDSWLASKEAHAA